MSHHPPYGSGNPLFSFPLNGHSANGNGSSTSSRQTHVATANNLFLSQYPGIPSGFGADLGHTGLNSVRNVMPPPEDRSGLAARAPSDPLLRFTSDRDGPWNPQRSRVGAHVQTLPPVFPGYRETIALSECETSVDDSGYGSQARQSVGTHSVFGDLDQTPESLLSQLPEFRISQGSSHSSFGNFQPQAVSQFGQAYSSVPPSRPDTVPNHPCQYCQHTSRTYSDHKKHIARHEKPHRCTIQGCKRKDGFATANDLDRHTRSVHEKAGSRYRCHHGTCTSEMPVVRPDNFRKHLSSSHHIDIGARDPALNDYIYRPPRPEILSNVGVAPELTLPPVHASSAPPIWSQVEQDARVQASGTQPGEEVRPSHDDYLQPPVRQECRNVPHHQQADGPVVRRDHDLAFDVSPRHTPNHGPQVNVYEDGRTYENIPPGGVPGFVRPNDLRSRTPEAMDSASPGTWPEEDGMLLDDDEEDDREDERIGASGGTDDRQNHYQMAEHRSPLSPPKSLQGCDGLGRSLIDDMVEQNKARAEADSHPNPVSVTDDKVKAGSSPASTASPEEVDDMGTEETEATFRKLMEKLDEEQLEKLLLRRGFVKPKAQQAKPQKKAVQGSSPSLSCPREGCDKTFARPCLVTKHLMRHDRPYRCTRCSTDFGSKSDWKRHENCMHRQYEIWRCDERLKGPLSDEVACHKVCNRAETFRSHLVGHHGFGDSRTAEDKQRLEAKLDKCHHRDGEVRFWCGFCVDIVELDTDGMSANEKCSARFNHIDNHLSGRKGMVKKEHSQWVSGDCEGADGDATKSVAKDETRKETKAVSANAEGAGKRKGDGAARATKRARMAPPGEENVVNMWYCCQCETPWSISNAPSCITINCVNHVRCSECRVECVRGQDD